MFDTLFIQDVLRTLSYSVIPVLLGIILHEVAHGYMALKKGDATAAMLGRLTLNPVPHIDPLGLFVFILTAVTSPFIFGWAKPVPVVYRNLRNPKKDMVWIAAAGPLANIFLALVFALLFKLLVIFAPTLTNFPDAISFLGQMFRVGIFANLALAFVNLLPIPPLDGSKIITGFLPNKMAYQYLSIERYGMIILVLLVATGLLSQIIVPAIGTSVAIIATLFGI